MSSNDAVSRKPCSSIRHCDIRDEGISVKVTLEPGTPNECIAEFADLSTTYQLYTDSNSHTRLFCLIDPPGSATKFNSDTLIVDNYTRDYRRLTDYTAKWSGNDDSRSITEPEGIKTKVRLTKDVKMYVATIKDRPCYLIVSNKDVSVTEKKTYVFTTTN